MIELIVYNTNIEAVGEVSDYESLIIERKYDGVSKLVLRVEYSEDMVKLLQKGMILADYEKPTYGYYIDHFSVVLENQSMIIEVFAYSLNYFLNWRIMPRQQFVNGSDLATAIRHFVDYNMISSQNPNRNINGLSLGTTISGLPISTYAATGEVLGEYLFGLCNEAGISMDVNMNLQTKGYTFDLWRGKDRTVDQTVNSSALFSVELENVMSFEYYDSDIDLRNVIYTAGEGQAGFRKLNLINSSLYKGLSRRELYVDARDLQSEFEDDNGNTVTLTPAQYDIILSERGREKSKEYVNIKSYESTVNDTDYVLGVNYDIGDIVTVYDRTLEITMDVRVIQVTTTSNKKGVRLQPSFGTGVPRRLKGGF